LGFAEKYRVGHLIFALDAKVKSAPPHPNPLPKRGRGGRELISVALNIEFGWIFQVDVAREHNSVGSLSLGERAGVRVLLNLPDNYRSVPYRFSQEGSEF
jgi:hypothetical protein